MSKLRSSQKAYLQGQFDNRVCFSKTERVLYGHDIAAMPSLIKPLIGNTIPNAVVQPQSEEELVELVRWAKNRYPYPARQGLLRLRRRAPVKKGVVVDFYRMNKISTSTRLQDGHGPGGRGLGEAGPGARENKALTLRLYPTSYPASTVGGWLAQGGAGIGSYEAGWFSDNVVSARVVLPTGRQGFQRRRT